MTGMSELYQSVIIEHDRQPRNFRKLEHATHHADGRNPFCGDEIVIELQVDADRLITDIAFQGSGCAVSRASASMMTSAQPRCLVHCTAKFLLKLSSSPGNAQRGYSLPLRTTVLAAAVDARPLRALFCR